MELILISRSKLKIMLTSDDMLHYELDANTIDYADVRTRSALRSILNEAKEETGFDSSSERVFIQIYPSREGGCEMFVTKLELVSKDENHEEKGLVPFENVDIKSEERDECASRSSGSRGDCAYSFDSVEALLSLCRRLACFGEYKNSSAYLDIEGKYYLFFNEYDGKYALADELSFLSEYGTRENLSLAKAYILEYGNCICDSDAIGILSKC